MILKGIPLPHLSVGDRKKDTRYSATEIEANLISSIAPIMIIMDQAMVLMTTEQTGASILARAQSLNPTTRVLCALSFFLKKEQSNYGMAKLSS